MIARQFISRLNRIQQTTMFKIIASCVVLAVGVTSFAVYFTQRTAPAAVAPAEPPKEAAPPAADPGKAAAEAAPDPDRSAFDAANRMINDLLQARQDPTSVAIGIGIGTAIALAVVWLGLGLTYLALLAAAFGVGMPLWWLAGTDAARGWGAAGTLRFTAWLLLGCVVLTASFTALMQALRVALSGGGPVFAVARNVLAEAVRMKISVVFIVLLILGLACLPRLLSQQMFLRYRVQSFLQYGTGGAFWIIALLVVFFSVASVCGEQRDKQIWQTMTKPVAAWQYLLGKWLGVSGLAAVLLAVCCSGVFLFTEYLRAQPAHLESAMTAAEGGPPSEDRFILETQVLAARLSVEPALPPINPDELEKAVASRIQAEKQLNEYFDDSPSAIAKMRDEMARDAIQSYRSIEPGQNEVYVFGGLRSAKERNLPLTLRYRIDAGGNEPGEVYTLGLLINGEPQPVQRVGLGTSSTLTLLPTAIDDQGRLVLEIINGLPQVVERQLRVVPNPRSVLFPPGGLELSFSVGSYRANFLRVALVLWVKLAFLAILGITAATFLSFPVACLVAITAFLAAEGASFLTTSLESYATTTQQGEAIYYKVVVAAISQAVAWAFKTYSDLKPTTRLVDGRLVGWGNIGWATLVISAWSAALYGLGVLIFRRRELATYSGQ